MSPVTCTLCLPLLCFQSVQLLIASISQGSVATHLKCGGMRNNPLVANFLLTVAAEERQRYGQEFGVCFFSLTHSVDLEECTYGASK